jgi:hypothetical protein
MTDSQQHNWESITRLLSDIKRCDECGIAMASVAMAYICIDAMSNLARPINKQKVTRADFKEWVDTYLEGHSDQPYQYRGKDVYAARCAFLHTYGVEAELHDEDPDTIQFGYNNGGSHQYNPNVNPRLVLVGTKSFINDVVIAVDTFREKCETDEVLRQLVEPRLGKVLQVYRHPSP